MLFIKVAGTHMSVSIISVFIEIQFIPLLLRDSFTMYKRLYCFSQIIIRMNIMTLSNKGERESGL